MRNLQKVNERTSTRRTHGSGQTQSTQVEKARRVETPGVQASRSVDAVMIFGVNARSFPDDAVRACDASGLTHEIAGNGDELAGVEAKLQSLKASGKVGGEGGVVVVAAHGRVENGKHQLRLSEQYVDTDGVLESIRKYHDGPILLLSCHAGHLREESGQTLVYASKHDALQDSGNADVLETLRYLGECKKYGETPSASSIFVHAAAVNSESLTMIGGDLEQPLRLHVPRDLDDWQNLHPLQSRNLSSTVPATPGTPAMTTTSLSAVTTVTTTTTTTTTSASTADVSASSSLQQQGMAQLPTQGQIPSGPDKPRLVGSDRDIQQLFAESDRTRVDLASTDRSARLRNIYDVHTYRGKPERVQALLKKYPTELETPQMLGEGINCAAAGKNGHVVQMFLDRGVSVNALNKKGETPLMNAALVGDLAAVKLLVGKGAGIDLTDHDGAGALFRASKEGHMEVLKFLVEVANADLDAGDEYGFNAAGPFATKEAGAYLNEAKRLRQAARNAFANQPPPPTTDESEESQEEGTVAKFADAVGCTTM